jgi:16S rRNA processing protein RimM
MSSSTQSVIDVIPLTWIKEGGDVWQKTSIKKPVELAKVIGAWGLNGECLVEPYNQTSTILHSLDHVWFVYRSRESGDVCFWAKASILRSKDHSGRLRLSFDEIKTPEQADLLRGARIVVERDSFPPLESNEFYWVDLEGLVAKNGKGEVLGVVSRVVDFGAHPVLEVDFQVGNEAVSKKELIPFVDKHVPEVNLKQGFLVVDWVMDGD